jgi:hypothetical protein
MPFVQPHAKLTAKEVPEMTLTRKDATATVLTLLAVLTYAATHEGWNVPLVGGSHRWAAGAIMLLGMFTCGLGSPGRGVASWLLATLGMLAFALAALALVTGSLTPLSLLVADIVVLWAVSTFRHAWQVPRKPIAA